MNELKGVYKYEGSEHGIGKTSGKPYLMIGLKSGLNIVKVFPDKAFVESNIIFDGDLVDVVGTLSYDGKFILKSMSKHSTK